MATSSILHDIEIAGEENIERFVNALEEAEKMVFKDEAECNGIRGGLKGDEHEEEN